MDLVRATSWESGWPILKIKCDYEIWQVTPSQYSHGNWLSCFNTCLYYWLLWWTKHWTFRFELTVLLKHYLDSNILIGICQILENESILRWTDESRTGSERKWIYCTIIHNEILLHRRYGSCTIEFWSSTSTGAPCVPMHSTDINQQKMMAIIDRTRWLDRCWLLDFCCSDLLSYGRVWVFDSKKLFHLM